MKKILYLLVLATVIFSCDNTKTDLEDNTKATPKQNDLLPDKVIVYNEVNYKDQPFPEWTDGVDSAYMNQLNDYVLESDIQYYSSNVFYDPSTKIEMTKEDVISNMQVENPEGISALYFVESWEFDKATYSFEKNVESWSPVFNYTKEEEGKILAVKKLLYDVRGTEVAEEKLIAENITYEMNFNSEHKTNEYLDIDKLAKMIVQPVIDGEMKAYEFFDKTELKPVEVKYVFGHTVDSVETLDSAKGEYVWEIIETKEEIAGVEAFIFVEDWYINTKTFAIRKKVKSIAPVVVAIKVDETGEAYETKRIAFIVNLY